jgi:hypothetical protein
LLNSRDRWKAKALERLEELKALQKKATVRQKARFCYLCRGGNRLS